MRVNQPQLHHGFLEQSLGTNAPQQLPWGTPAPQAPLAAPTPHLFYFIFFLTGLAAPTSLRFPYRNPLSPQRLAARQHQARLSPPTPTFPEQPPHASAPPRSPAAGPRGRSGRRAPRAARRQHNMAPAASPPAGPEQPPRPPPPPRRMRGRRPPPFPRSRSAPPPPCCGRSAAASASRSRRSAATAPPLPPPPQGSAAACCCRRPFSTPTGLRTSGTSIPRCWPTRCTASEGFAVPGPAASPQVSPGPNLPLLGAAGSSRGSSRCSPEVPGPPLTPCVSPVAFQVPTSTG